MSTCYDSSLKFSGEGGKEREREKEEERKREERERKFKTGQETRVYIKG